MTDDDQFGQRLGTLLREEVSNVHAAPDLTRRLRGRAKRKRLSVGAGAAVLTAMVAAVGLLVPTGPDGLHTRPGPDVGPVSTQAPRTPARTTDYLLLTRNEIGAEWTDAATGRTREDIYADDGKRLSWTTLTTTDTDGGRRWLEIQWLLRWWSQGHTTAAELTQQIRPDPFENLPTPDPESISKALADGTFEIVGNETLDGRDTLRLRVETTIEIGRGKNATSFPRKLEIWVDPDNYLPYRTVITTTQRWGASTVSTTYAWMERTKENLMVFDVTPPAEFDDRTG
ncbi:hypothetical protein Ais01nite_00040 [Asanoa ishikariensis]|uniref:Uncharacterized protein n=1 Tax=Asanoa ishikariensis TaxID=137265 RepID=A0A1H3TRB1_9ACTN|nr:hypothetical protein [Asanoa ishikariensis]GIF61969.1 hypothetical protein Ais01nite_00040 [Asanoa ishikariensis]SDZ52547.1 hypothetical protein SAMN05421684_6219 [Asanoa ishikariensis]